MRIIISALLLFLSIDIFGQSAGTGTRPTGLLSEATGLQSPAQLSHSLVKQQVTEWRARVKQQSQDQRAWFQYYQWIDKSQSLDAAEKKRLLSELMKDANGFIANSSLYKLMEFLQSGKQDSVSLFEAAAQKEQVDIVYPYLLQFRIKQPSPANRMMEAAQLEQSDPLSNALRLFYSNMLQSSSPNGHIWVKGINDCKALAVLQDVYNIRKDVTLHLYEPAKQIPAGHYLALSLGNVILEKFPGSQYTGLLVKTGSDESLTSLVSNFESKIDLSMAQFDNVDESVRIVQRNYLPGMILLHRHYKALNDAKQYSWREKIERIAQKLGIETTIQSLLKK